MNLQQSELWKRKQTLIKGLGYLGLLLIYFVLISAPVWGQDQQPETALAVTDDQVNAIAKKLYCPVCENIPLDACGTAACADWRYEIRLQLEAGMTEKQIVDDFVDRFGDRVVGTPQNTILRIMSLVTPLLIIAAGLYFGWQFFVSRRPKTLPVVPVGNTESNAASTYRDLLEQDIAGS